MIGVTFPRNGLSCISTFLIANTKSQVSKIFFQFHM